MVRLPVKAREFSPQCKERLWIRSSLQSVVDWRLLVAGLNCRGMKFPIELYYLVPRLKVCVAMPLYTWCVSSAKSTPSYVARLPCGIT